MSRIKSIPIEHFEERLYCDCGGSMEWNHMTLTSNPPWYPHVCKDCGKGENMRHVYPHTTYQVRKELSE